MQKNVLYLRTGLKSDVVDDDGWRRRQGSWNVMFSSCTVLEVLAKEDLNVGFRRRRHRDRS